jgi:hypothetical protein
MGLEGALVVLLLADCIQPWIYSRWLPKCQQSYAACALSQRWNAFAMEALLSGIQRLQYCQVIQVASQGNMFLPC